MLGGLSLTKLRSMSSLESASDEFIRCVARREYGRAEAVLPLAWAENRGSSYLTYRIHALGFALSRLHAAGHARWFVETELTTLAAAHAELLEAIDDVQLADLAMLLAITGQTNAIEGLYRRCNRDWLRFFIDGPGRRYGAASEQLSVPAGILRALPDSYSAELSQCEGERPQDPLNAALHQVLLAWRLLLEDQATDAARSGFLMNAWRAVCPEGTPPRTATERVRAFAELVKADCSLPATRREAGLAELHAAIGAFEGV